MSPNGARVSPVPGGPPSGMSQDFLGGEQGGASAPSPQGPSDTARMFLTRIHDLESQVMELARALPAASAEFRMVVTGLRKAMAKAAQAVSQEPESAPQP